jgi:hypothetical protein
MSLRLSALRKKGIMALFLLVGPSCRGITVEGGEDTSGEATSTGSTSTGSTSGATTSTRSGSGGGGQSTSSSGAAGGSNVDAGCGSDGGTLDPSGYPDGGGPLGGSGTSCFPSLAPCPDDEFCRFFGPHCGFPHPGTMAYGACRKPPTDCTDVCPVVCGCDGKWYLNECQANAAGYSIGPNGNCPPGGMP